MRTKEIDLNGAPRRLRDAQRRCKAILRNIEHKMHMRKIDIETQEMVKRARRSGDRNVRRGLGLED